MSPLTKFALRNLGNRPFVTTLVLSALVVTALTIAGAGGVIDGVRRAFASQGHEAWVVVLARDSEGEAFSVLSGSELNRITISSDIKRFSPEVVVRVLAPLRAGGVAALTLRALEPQGFEMHGLQMIEGRMPTAGSPEMIVGEDLRKHMPWLTIGGTITALNETFTCVGIFRAAGYLAGEAWTTRATILSDPRRMSLSVVYLETQGKAQAEGLASQLNADRSVMLAAATEPARFAKMAKEQEHLVDAMTLILVLVVGGAVLAASSFLALLQGDRMQELCTLRAIGFRSAAITTMIILETELLALAGATLGVALAGLALRNYTVHSITADASAFTFSAQMHGKVIVAAVVLMLAVGLISSIAPIIRVRRMSITQGLREE